MDSGIIVAVISAIKDLSIACINKFTGKSSSTPTSKADSEKMDIPPVTHTKTVAFDENEISNTFLPGAEQLEAADITDDDYVEKLAVYLAINRSSDDIYVFLENNEE